MLSSHNHYITDFLREQYPEQFTTFRLVPYKGDISVFVIRFENEAELNREWNNMSGYIAGYYQAELANIFEKWNIYVFYLCKETISISLKYKIENDRFSSRKIVIDAYDTEITDLSIGDIINEHITNGDIIFSNRLKQQGTAKNLESGSVVWDLIRDVTLKPGRSNNQETENILLQLEEKIKNENKKS